MAPSGHESLDFLPKGSLCREMAKTDGEHPHHQGMDDVLLSAIWSRLQEAERLATSADAMDNMAHIGALAGEVCILARTLELIRPTKPAL